jgi:hypothetical protein
MSVHLFGVRHHGPGCARSLRAALERLAPDIVLVEGPPDAHDALPLMREATMRPPVALLIYAPDAPGQAVYYPFARFSPEWQALDYALGVGVPARFIDLPIAVRFAQGPPGVAPDAEPDAALDAEASRRMSRPPRCGKIRWRCWRRRRATTTTSCGGSGRSSSAATWSASSRASSKR